MRLLFALFLLTATPFLFASPVIRIAVIDWCPQLCPLKEREGYILDLVREIYRPTGYRLELGIYPWSRALAMVRQGKVDAVLSPAKAEAPDLRYPRQEVGVQRMCFFVSREDDWRYQSLSDLAGKQFGLARDTSLEELNHYVESNPQQFQYQPYSERFIAQQVRKVLKGRIDAFLFTYNSTLFELNSIGVSGQVKSAGCVSSANVYMAFSPVAELEPEVTRMMALFDRRMQQLKQTDLIAQVMSRYGLQDWRLNEQSGPLGMQ